MAALTVAMGKDLRVGSFKMAHTSAGTSKGEHVHTIVPDSVSVPRECCSSFMSLQ